MKKVYIVDDEKLVRKGIISTFPWEKHGFVVAGDTGSGEKALEFIKNNDIDLLITDLTMPVMSGFELIKKVKAERPDIDIAILTCHDDFKYIQDAIRMGVLDYIVKTEIEDEAVEETLHRLSSKMKDKSSNFILADVRREDSAARWGILICGRRYSCDAMKLLNLGVKSITSDLLITIDKQTWIIPEYGILNRDRNEEGFITDLSNEDWVQSKITNIDVPINEETVKTLKFYRRKILFYSYQPSQSNYNFSMDNTMNFENDNSEEKRRKVFERWKEMSWIYSDGNFEQMLLESRTAGIDRKSLLSIFNNAATEYDKLFETNALQSLLENLDDLLFWYDWEIWIRKFRTTIAERLIHNYSDEATQRILKALEYIRKEDTLDLSQSEIAQRVNMSRSYFSRCFKKVMGRSFEDYYKELRLEKAKSMISMDNEPISLIAEKCGFVDYRYFSRVFRESTGMLPTDYRKHIHKKHV